MMSEREVKNHFLEKCKERGYFARKVNWEGRADAPDWLVIRRNGTVLWVELKALGKKLRPAQAREIALMREYGQCVFVVDSPWSVDAVLI